MSNLYKSALQARIAKLPHPDTLAPFNAHEDDEDEASEAADSIGALPPGGGLGPPAMQVHPSQYSRIYAS